MDEDLYDNGEDDYTDKKDELSNKGDDVCPRCGFRSYEKVCPSCSASLESKNEDDDDDYYNWREKYR